MKLFFLLTISKILEGSGTSLYSQHQQQQQQSLAGNGKRPLDNRKLSYELRSNEMDIINKLRREAAERSNEMMADMLDGTDGGESIDDVTERILRKRSGYLSRLDEDSAMNDALLSPSRHLTRRSISRELFGGGGAPVGADQEQPRTLMSPTSSVSGSRPVTRRSISRELFDYTPSSGGRITPTYGLVGSSPARRTTTDYSRSSRERSLGRDSDNNDRPSLDRTRSSRRSESLTRGGGASSLASQPTSHQTSRPSLSTQGRSLTQNEFVRTSPRSSISGRLSAGIEEDSRIRYSDRGSSGSTGYGVGSSGSTGYGVGSSGSTGYGVGSSGYSSGSTSLNDRGRTDWRRVSVPERGKDYSTLQSKYKR